MIGAQHSLFAAEDAVTESSLPWAEAPVVAFAHWISVAKSPRGGLPYTQLSRTQFKSMWGQYCSYLCLRNSSVLKATPSLLDEFFRHQRGVDGKELAPVTIKRYLALLNRVYAELVRQQLCTKNPAAELWAFHRRPVAPAAVAHLNVSLDSQFLHKVSGLPEETWKQLRDKTMMLLLPGSGVTQSELLQLHESDVHLDEPTPYLQVPAHGRRDARAVSLSPFSVEALRKWLHYRRAANLRTAELFPAKTSGGLLNASTVYRHIGAVLQELGVSQQKGARRLRHTFAVRQLGAGAPESAVKDWLGLETDEMLSRYRKLVPSRYGATAV